MLFCGRRYVLTAAGFLRSSAMDQAARSGFYGSSLQARTGYRAPRSCLLAASTFWVTLERAGIEASDEALWKSGVFDAEVHPDLPPAWTIAELLRYYLRRAKEAMLGAKGNRGTTNTLGGGGGGGREAVATTTTGVCTPPSSGNDGELCQEGDGGGSYLVRTVPVQISRMEELRTRLAAAAGVDSTGAAIEGCRPANALLLVSGSHPGRRLPLMRHFLPDVYDELRLATSMRDSGHLPKRLAFWVVANPMVEADEAGVQRARKKVELGAEVIVTQPPLVWESFERWLRGVDATGALATGATLTNIGDKSAGEETPLSTRESGPDGRHRPGAAAGRGETRGAAVLVGLPVITSPQGVRFWLHLCGVDNNPGICEKTFEAFGNMPPTAQQTEQEAGATSDPSFGSEKTLDKAKVSPYGEAWLEATMSKLKSLDDCGLGVAGVHVMAPGLGPRRRASELAIRGVFGSSSRRGRE
eukprot:g10247.t1